MALGLPQILPDGKSILYTAFANYIQFSIRAQSLKSGESKELFAGIGARYLPTGHLVYVVGNNLLAVPFDPGRLETAGGSVHMVEGVYRAVIPQYALSDSGTLVYMPGATGGTAAGRTLVWVDREGKEEPLGTPPNPYRFPKISPDGTRVAVTIYGDNTDIWVWDLIRKTLTRMTFDKARDLQSIWTPDGKKIVFASNREGNVASLYWKSADGTGGEEKLGSMPGLGLMPWSWSSDGRTLITAETDGAAKWGIGMFSMEGERTRKPLLPEEATEICPKISPDGGYMAYASDESARTEVYVRPFPDVNKGKWQVSTSSGNMPLWSPDGRELFYLTLENSVMAVAVETKPTFSLGTPKALFRSTCVGNIVGEGTAWDISPDGKRFLMIKPPATTPSAEGGPRKINIVLNWVEELKQRPPVK
jgi:serine/threonine-protein kinase